MTEHTQGRVTFKEEGDANHWSMLTEDGRWLLALLHNGEAVSARQIANFRRLAACWNACEGVPTDVLEAASVSEAGLERFAAPVAVKEREALRQDGWRQCAVGQRTTQFCDLAEMAVAAEREACAQVCDDRIEMFESQGHDKFVYGAMCCADAIRARGAGSAADFVNACADACANGEVHYSKEWTTYELKAAQEPFISTEHGPWIESKHPGEEGESYCQRCLMRFKFLGARRCDPHIVASAPSPAQRKPLTDEQLRDALRTCPHDTVENMRVRWLYAKDFARAIEAAHGIKEQA